MAKSKKKYPIKLSMLGRRLAEHHISLFIFCTGFSIGELFMAIWKISSLTVARQADIYYLVCYAIAFFSSIAGVIMIPLVSKKDKKVKEKAYLIYTTIYELCIVAFATVIALVGMASGDSFPLPFYIYIGLMPAIALIDPIVYSCYTVIATAIFTFVGKNYINAGKGVLSKEYVTLLVFAFVVVTICFALYRYDEQHESKEGELNRMAYIDVLTSIGNRRSFDELIDYNKLHDIPYTLVAADIDLFKNINDSMGHDFGDEVLVSVGAGLSEVFPGKCYRYGGDEFFLVVPAELDDVKKKMPEVIESLRKQKNMADVSLSFGLAYVLPGQDSLVGFSKADKALYRAKKTAGYSYVTEREIL